MLSREARSDSIPGLEIEADDVRCTHGATSGRVDEEQIFYAQARGLTADEAARLVVAGFFQQVFDRITIPPVREALSAAIGGRIRRVSGRTGRRPCGGWRKCRGCRRRKNERWREWRGWNPIPGG